MGKQNPEQSAESVLKVENLWVRKGSFQRHKWILKDVSFSVKPGEFVAIIGPNGAGKTKLIEAIVGDRPYTGQVAFYNQDLYANPEYWLRKIGWVPTHSVLHDNLTADQALYQIGRLRLPKRPDKIILGRIDTLLKQLEFPQDRRSALIRDLSSGERKRLELTAELLTKPHLLILDEPTTNLDPDAERALMQLLRDRSWGKRQAILIITHTLQSLQYCDRVIFLANGRIRAEGSNEQVLDRLEVELEGVRQSQDGEEHPQGGISAEEPRVNSNHSATPQLIDDASRWASIYRKSRVFDREPVGDPPAKPAARPQGRLRARSKSWTHELQVLLRRNWLLFKNNPTALALYLLLGLFSGVLSRIVLRDNAFIQDPDVIGYSSVFDTSDARQAIFVISLVVTLLGLIGSFLDITKERHIYHYERVKGLSPWAYLLSKWVVLVALVGIVAPTFLMVVLTFQGQTVPSTAFVMVTLYLACIAAVTLGLAVSAAASSERLATGLLGIVVVFHVFFSGGVEFNERMRLLLERISVFAASHWASEGVSSSIQLYCWSSTPRFQDYYSFGHVFYVWLFLVVYIFAALILGYVALRMQDTWYSRRIRSEKALFNGQVWSIVLIVMVAASWGSFLKQRSEDYYHLRMEIDNVRVQNSINRDMFQSLTGLVSQSQCAVPTALPPPATPMVALPPTSAAIPTQTLVQGAAIYTPSPGSSQASDALDEPAVPPLPRGTVIKSVAIAFGPEHTNLSLDTLPEGAGFVLLGKDRTGEWFRIKEDYTGRELVGWIPVENTDLPASKTGLMAHPPRCAMPRSFMGGGGTTPAVEWPSDVSGHVVVVVDLFRPEAGRELPQAQLSLRLNGQLIEVFPAKDTRQSFVFRGLAIETTIAEGDHLQISLDEIPDVDTSFTLRAAVFFVPSGCSF